MPSAARIGDTVICPADIHTVPPVPIFGVPTPFPVVGQIGTGASRVKIDGAMAARENDTGNHNLCPGFNTFKITGHSEKVIIQGSKAARSGDATLHCEGDPTGVPPCYGNILFGSFRVIIH